MPRKLGRAGPGRDEVESDHGRTALVLHNHCTIIKIHRFTSFLQSVWYYSTPYAALQNIIQRYNEGRPEAQQLPPIPFHGLRHTSATLLIAGNQMDMRTVSSRLGHAQASTTMNIYAHALQEMDRKAVDTLEQMLAKEA